MGALGVRLLQKRSRNISLENNVAAEVGEEQRWDRVRGVEVRRCAGWRGAVGCEHHSYSGRVSWLDVVFRFSCWFMLGDEFYYLLLSHGSWWCCATVDTVVIGTLVLSLVFFSNFHHWSVHTNIPPYVPVQHYMCSQLCHLLRRRNGGKKNNSHLWRFSCSVSQTVSRQHLPRGSGDKMGSMLSRCDSFRRDKRRSGMSEHSHMRTAAIHNRMCFNPWNTPTTRTPDQ